LTEAVPIRRWLGPLLLAALGTSAWAWWRFAWPVVTWKALSRHSDHFEMLYAHMVGGTMMLAVGATALYIGWTRRAFRYHKLIGYTYLLGGGVGAGLGLALSLRNAHGITGITVATGTLAVVWLVVAAVAFRAAWNHRFEAHRQWMVRSYVLTWTFVACRLAGRVSALEALGDAGGAAIVWLSWVVPLFVCELALQWASTAAVKRSAARAG
jgi:hypothetical protein